MASNSSAQTIFMQNGGVFEGALQKMRETGAIPAEYEYHEYPKEVKVSQGVRDVKCSTEIVSGKDTILHEWVDTREVFDTLVVGSLEEEERVVAGGMSAMEIEDERTALFETAKQQGVKVDPTWGLLRIKKALGQKAEPNPGDEHATLTARLKQLEEIKALKAKIAAMEMDVEPVAPEPVPEPENLHELDAIDVMRSDLRAAGQRVDQRWGIDKLRAELDRVTAPAAE